MPDTVPWNEYVSLEPGSDLSQLAGFVVEAPVLRAGLVHGHAQTSLSGPQRRADIVELFTLLADARVGYRREALDDLGDQVVRPWDRFAWEGATCLDLALVACAQLLAVDLRPHLVLDYGRTGAGSNGETNHALVLADLDSVRTARAGRRPGGGIRNDGPAGSWPHVARLDESWVLFDPTEACSLASQNFERAEQVAWNRLLEGKSDETWLIDIAAGRSDPTVERRKLPDAEAPGLLSRRCPPPPRITGFASRERDANELLERSGTTVLIGPRGAGKSVLAVQAVATATRGFGWFLNGSSSQALISSLAAAEGYERDLSTAVVAADAEGFARAALGRLHAIDGPWTVVVDNADLPVRELREYLPRANPRRRQHLIITSTDLTAEGHDAHWRDTVSWRPAATVLDVKLLEPAEVRAELSALLGDVAGGVPDGLRLPLMVRAVRSLLDDDHRGAAETVVLADDPLSSYWQVLRDEVLKDEVELLRTARLCALLPADGVPTNVYEIIAEEGARRWLTRLSDLGLLSAAADTWSMHRLFGAAVRSDDGHIETAAPLAAALLSHSRAESFLARAYDATVVKHLRELLSSGQADNTAAGAALAVLASIIDQRGTALEASQVAGDALQRLGPGSDPDLWATCLLAQARYVNQHAEKAAREHGRSVQEVLVEALTQAERAEHLALDPMLGGKALAMRGLLIKKIANRAETGDSLTKLREAEKLILDARDIRQALVNQAANDHAATQSERAVDQQRLDLELAKAQFNVGGISINLAQADPENAQHALVRAREAYESVGEIRRTMFGAAAHRHVAACVHGEALAAYYTALLVDKTAPEVVHSLREATKKARQALAERELLEPDLDGEDVAKSVQLLSKIALARVLVASGSPESLDKLVTKAQDELAGLLGRLNASPEIPTL